MKTAKATAQRVTLDCPNCGDPMLTPRGELVWDAVDFWERKVVLCKSNSCGMTCVFPSVADTNAGEIGAIEVDPPDYFDDPIGQKRVCHGSPR